MRTLARSQRFRGEEEDESGRMADESEEGGQQRNCEGRAAVPPGNFRPRIEMLLRYQHVPVTPYSRPFALSPFLFYFPASCCPPANTI